MAVLGELVDLLPPADLFRQSFHHSLSTGLPFVQRGLSLQRFYTYRLGELSDGDKVWAGLSASRRRRVQKAQTRLEVRSSDDIDLFLRLNHSTFSRQGLQPPYSDDAVRRIDDARAQRGARRILVAFDERGTPHGAEYLVYDETTAYDLMFGARRQLPGQRRWQPAGVGGDPFRRHAFSGSRLQRRLGCGCRTLHRQFRCRPGALPRGDEGVTALAVASTGTRLRPLAITKTLVTPKRPLTRSQVLFGHTSGDVLAAGRNSRCSSGTRPGMFWPQAETPGARRRRAHVHIRPGSSAVCRR